MTVVLVHGVPETAAVWDPLVERLVALGHEEPIRLSPPGFGAAVPAGWGATMEDYRLWLVDELAARHGPVDLVGHDWGGGHVLGVAMTRPDLLRTWVSDVPGIFDPDYVWHPLAQQWQGLQGRSAVAALTDAPLPDRVAALASAGMDEAVAARVAEGVDTVMGACILRLYRSAAQPNLAEAGADLEAAAARPGLAVLASQDHNVGTDGQRRRAALRAGARTVVLEGHGHWWMTTDPEGAAHALVDFWRHHD